MYRKFLKIWKRVFFCLAFFCSLWFGGVQAGAETAPEAPEPWWYSMVPFVVSEDEAYTLTADYLQNQGMARADYILESLGLWEGSPRNCYLMYYYQISWEDLYGYPDNSGGYIKLSSGDPMAWPGRDNPLDAFRLPDLAYSEYFYKVDAVSGDIIPYDTAEAFWNEWIGGGWYDDILPWDDWDEWEDGGEGSWFPSFDSPGAEI